ncbi:unnamed protein product [Rotaria socialis]|uniref:Uncharacterized protein n=1 Tax=Rotaria socialis TaxID=392032 RepID=A0A820AVW5_9BILA|nr:unnamed protein product [Rotaria socialis]CAF4193493.1 unnamed protein product [Rotaria socialis]
MATNNDDLLTETSNPILFIRAGTTGIRHLLPIRLNDGNYNDDLFCRSISHLRFHVPTNQLSSNIETIQNICSSIQTLEYFDISHNELNNLPIEIALLNHLHILICSHNKLMTISDTFEKLHSLKQIDLSFNRFKTLPNVISNLKYLVRLNCEHNSIKIVSINLLKLKFLKVLILDHNQIETLDGIDFSQLKRLEYIHMAHNQLIKFPRNLHRLTYLKNVNLSYNRLTYFPIELLLINTLDVLDLSHNLFTQLPTLIDAYRRTTLMFSIDLSFNQLTKIYDYLLLISSKLDLSNNKIQSIPNNLMKILYYNTIKTRELKLHHNPLVYPTISSEILNEENTTSRNMLPILRSSFDEQQMNEPTRQGFKIYITGCKNSGKSSLAYCLEEQRPLIDDEKDPRLVNILQCPFYNESDNEYSYSETKSLTSVSKQSHFDIDLQIQKKLSRKSGFLTFISPPSSTIMESKKPIPLSIFDFNGSSEHYEQMSIFIDTNAVHLICIHSVDFDKQTPKTIEEIFQDNFDITSYPIVKQLLQILQILCEKITKTSALMIIPIVTCIDLYNKQSIYEKNQLLDKINRFFKFFLESRINRIKHEIELIDRLPIISPSLSDRLKTYTSLLNLNIEIESCQSVSSLTYEGMDELNQKIQYCIATQKTLFSHVNRILPTLWAETNRYIESLVDHLPVPYVKWESFTSHINKKYGLSDVVHDITMSLSDQGKILVLNEIGTSNRIVFLRPLWLGDLLSELFHNSNSYESTTFQSHKKEYHEYGRLHYDLNHLLWNRVLHKKDYFYPVWNVLMRYLLIAYPKLNKKQLKSFLNSEAMKFDHIIVPYYLPSISLKEHEQEKKRFFKQLTNKVNVCYKSATLSLGCFHRYSVLALLKSDVIYMKHWNDFIVGEYKEKQVKFIIETNHHTYVNFYCGTNVMERPFDNVWHVLMCLLNLFEEMFKVLAPGSQFTRLACCPYCHEYSFMGEWTTPKELQGLKIKICSSCGQNVDTNYLIQPNENKRRNEELLKKIRERNAKTKKNANVTLSTTTNATYLCLPSI